MKKILVLLMITFSLFSEKEDTKFSFQAAPYIQGEIFQPGYGLSLRMGYAGHTFEIAPLTYPPSGGFFGSHTKRIGLSSSYYYVFGERLFQPYLGLSYLYKRDLHRSVIWEHDGNEVRKHKDSLHHENLFTTLVGVQMNQFRRFPGYVFIDVQGPVFYDGYFVTSFIIPRLGLGLQF